MGKRYYCDYCDRSFHDSAENRKKHINGVQHQKMRKLHYDAYRSATEILDEESAKNPCKRFRLSGNCDFGTACRYSHLTPADIYNLQEQARKEKTALELKDLDVVKVDDSWVKAWINKVEMTGPGDGVAKSSTLPIEFEIGSWSIPMSLATYYNLPPSLIPPTFEDFKTAELASWQ